MRGDKFYLCRVKSVWDRKLGRARKITGEYLGRITPEGLVPPKHKRVEEMYASISVKEFGATHFLTSISGDIIQKLKENYPHEWKDLFALAVFRLTDKSPLSRIGLCYQTSYLSESLGGVRTSQGFLGPFMRNIGAGRERMKRFMQAFMAGECAAIDITDILTYSENVVSAAMGHNHDRRYVPQVNLLLIYSLDKLHQPVYFRMVPGSISDVSTIVSTVKESAVRGITLIGDKGFHSDPNVQELKDNGIGYILSLRRDSRFISYGRITGDRRSLGCFVFGKRHVWFSDYAFEGERIVTYLDERLKADEESDAVMRIKRLEAREKKEGLNEGERKMLKECRERIYEKPFRNGTLSVRTSVKDPPEKVYQMMKSRMEVEQCFDTFKNTLDADRSYMRDDRQLEGWLFVNFIAMQMYYRIYAILLEKELLGKHSPSEVISHLKRVHMIKAGGKWRLAEIPKKSVSVIKELGIEMPITKNV